jgi:MFS family permease
MNLKDTARNLLITIFSFIVFAQLIYTYQNIRMFNSSFTNQTDEQVQELGAVIANEIATALKYKIPLNRIGQVNRFLKGIVDDTPNINFIDIIENDKQIYSASRSREALRVLSVPIENPDGKMVAEIKLGISPVIEKYSNRILFDLFTIVMVGLIITYELLIFFTSRMLHIPGQETMMAANCLFTNLETFPLRINSQELSDFLSEISLTVENTRRRIENLYDDINELAQRVSRSVRTSQDKVLEQISKQKEALLSLSGKKAKFTPIINPAHARPMVFTFILAANLHSSFLPFFAQDLLHTPTVLTGMFSEKVLMGLPITAYMMTVMITMIILGSGRFDAVSPFRSICISLLFTAAGLIFCGLAQDIVTLILARMLCAVGFALIVLNGRQFIVDHSRSERRAFHLAGYTTAFSGGMFSSIVIGGIMADYFSYRIVFFTAAGLLIFVFLFAHFVFAERPVFLKDDRGKRESGLARFVSLCMKDRRIIAVILQGIITRIMLVGFYYYAIPIFLRSQFAFSDIGRIMMFYGLTSILLASYLNKYIKRVEQSEKAIIISNIVLGLSFTIFYFLNFTSPVLYAAFAIAGLVILSISNIYTFPSQVNLLLDTDTVKTMGNRVPLATYQSLERVGSALGPMMFGILATYFDIHEAIGVGGMVCLTGNLIFIALYRRKKSPKKS